MKDYLLRRIILGVVTIWIVTIVIFTILRVIPGDVVTLITGEVTAESGSQTAYVEERLTRLRTELGLDDPLPVQYGKWVWGIVRFDPGTSFVTLRPVLSMVKERWPVTIQLALMTFVISIVLALFVGTISALKQDTWTDYLLRITTIGGLSVPSFWAGIMLVLGLALVVGYMAPQGYRPIQDDPWGSLQQLALPALVLGWRSSALLGRLVRSTTLEILREDYVRTAHAKGLAPNIVIIRHVLRNAAIPVVTVMGFQLGSIVAGTAVIETVFGLPGMGRLLVEAIRSRDYPVVQFMVMLLSIWVITINITIDVMYGWLDPRIRFR